jgi:hypothetical protein
MWGHLFSLIRGNGLIQFSKYCRKIGHIFFLLKELWKNRVFLLRAI